MAQNTKLDTAQVNKINFLSEPKERDNITEYKVEPPFHISGHGTRVGIDPGTKNLGIALLYPENKSLYLFKVKLERDDDPVKRMVDAQMALQSCIQYHGYDPIATIEGASFGNYYRQVELAEQRAAMALWFYARNFKVVFGAPKSIRKAVFGNGNEKNPWDNLDDDLAAALGACYYNGSKR